ncbi:MAG: alpha/beta fold hydrolase [Actinobacteria bacterium]|nr:alpha/beta fold hydrolase [Actinomycetota bacterium]
MISLLRAWSHRFGVPVGPLAVTTSDGVRLVGARLGTGDTAVVLCHGFMGWHRKPRVARLAEMLGERFTVYAFDLRGHGESSGRCSFGGREIDDVAAVVSLARADGHGRVVTVGASMGGIAVIRHAALIGGVDAVVAVSTPARWVGHGTEAVRRMTRLTSTRWGRGLMRTVGVRLSRLWEEPESPEDVVAKIAPIPLVIVHGRDDHYFDEGEAWRLYRRAGEPKRLLLASRFGHGEDGFTREFADRLSREIESMRETAWSA